MDDTQIESEFHKVTDTPANIEKWIAKDNEELRHKASLDNKNEFDLPSGRHYAERVLELKRKKAGSWTGEDHEFAQRVVNYAHRSAGISEHHPHAEKSEVGGTGMTKNEIARRNWGLPAKP